MPRKKDPLNPPRVNLGVRYAPSAVELFDALAAEHNMDRSEVVRRLTARGYRSLKAGEKP